MFNSLTGTVTAKLPQTLCLQTDGIEWELSVPDTSLNALPPVGDTARVYTWLLHRDDTMKLFGFSSVHERALFLDLLKVEGMGPKGALKVLSNVSGRQLVETLDAGDVAVLEKLPGIGKKTAQKMLLALKGKLTLLDDDGAAMRVVREKAVSPWNDVIQGLVDMGYDRKACEETVDRLASQLGLNADELGTGEKRSAAEGQLLRSAIVELAR